MWQELFRIPFLNIPIYGYGLMLVIGFIAAVQLGRYLANRRGLNGEIFVNAGLLALASGIIGARLSHVIENLGVYTDPANTAWENLRNALNISSGGLTYYGGFLLAFPTLVLYALWKKVPLRTGMDIVAPCLMIGLGFGRIGCFLNGCCYGAECSLPWAVEFPYHSPAYMDQVSEGKIKPPPELRFGNGEGSLLPKDRLAGELADIAGREHARPVHPTELYASLTAFLLAGLLWAHYTVPHVAGRTFAWMLMLYAIGRFIEELLRVEPSVMHLWGRGLSYSMVVSLLLLPLGAVLWWLFGWIGPEAGGAIGSASSSSSTKPRSTQSR